MTSLSHLLRFLSFVLLLSTLPVISFAQFDAGPNDTVNTGVPVTLTATYGLIGTGITISDDGVEGPFPIGFSFSFFGDNYTEFYAGANGWISFSPNPNARGTRQPFAIPNAADYNPKNCILGPFQDMNPIIAGTPYIFYRTLGQDSNRRLVVMWCQTPMYECMDSLVTFQIVLNEGSNTIENHLMRKPSCTDWQGNQATQGVQNITGYIGYAVPGRNATSWTARMEGWKYTPTSTDSFQIAPIPYVLQPIVPGEKITYRWICGAEQISSRQSTVVAPSQTTTYYATCTLCDGQEFSDSVTVVVIPYLPNAFTPNGDGLNDVFGIIGIPPENITEFNLQVFSRWGEVVFSTTDPEESWDGTVGGKPAPEGVYVWAIWYMDSGRHTVTNKGTLTLIR